MYLDRKFLLGKQKLQEQREALWVAGGCSCEFGTEFFAQVCQRTFRQRTVHDQAVVAGEPAFSDSFFEFVFWIDRRMIQLAPRARVEGGRRRVWIDLCHGSQSFPRSLLE